MVYAVLLSGGTGTRLGYKVPKQFIEINDKPLLAYCIEKFANVAEFKKIIVSSPKNYLYKTNNLVNSFFPDNSNIVVIVGGETRQDTLMKSLNYIKSIDNSNAIVISHDAARIFVSINQIKECIRFTKEYGSASPVIPSTDVIIEKNGQNIKNIPNRYDMVHVQTPQGFKVDEYLNLFNNLSKEDARNVHEIISIYYLNDKYIKLFDGEKSNFKITYPTDINISKFILKGD